MSDTKQTFTVNGTKTFELTTRAPNGIADGTSSITVSLKDGTGTANTDYRVADSPNDTATVSVTDESRPVLSITADSATVEEGQPLNFTVSIKPSDVKVEYQYSIAETGNFVETRRKGLNTKGTSARRYNQITVNTNAINPELEPDSVVTLQLEPGLQQDGRVRVTPTYFIDPAGSASASVTVTDNNAPTGGLSIVAFNRVITEGDYARFQIRSSTAVSQTTAVIVKFTNDTSGRNFITQANSKSTIKYHPFSRFDSCCEYSKWTKIRRL